MAIVREIVATAMLKASDGFEKPMWAIGSMLCYGLCFLFFAPALKLIPVGVAYAIWSGLGIVAISVVGILVFGDKLNLPGSEFLLGMPGVSEVRPTSFTDWYVITLAVGDTQPAQQLRDREETRFVLQNRGLWLCH